jgi:hypothetical protein
MHGFDRLIIDEPLGDLSERVTRIAEVFDDDGFHAAPSAWTSGSRCGAT